MSWTENTLLYEHNTHIVHSCKQGKSNERGDFLFLTGPPHVVLGGGGEMHRHEVT